MWNTPTYYPKKYPRKVQRLKPALENLRLIGTCILLIPCAIIAPFAVIIVYIMEHVDEGFPPWKEWLPEVTGAMLFALAYFLAMAFYGLREGVGDLAHDLILGKPG